MKWIFSSFTLLICIFSQAQSIQGVAVDKNTEERLAFANVILLQNDTIISGTTTNSDGQYSITNLKPGTYSMEFSYVGYSTLRIGNIRITNDSNLIIEAILSESAATIEGPTITGYSNDFEIVTLRDLHFDEMPGAYEDPSRLMIKVPSVSTSNDQSNAITTKGIPPHFNKWAINNTEIVNPNHLSNAGIFSDKSSPSFGGVNMINSRMIDTYQFLFSPFDKDFYNAAGYSNITLDDNLKQGLGLNLSLLGLQADYTKVVKDSKKFRNSKITASYRYSTVGLLTALGLDLGEEEIQFQDVVFTARTQFGRNRLKAYFVGGIHSNRHGFYEKEEPIFKDLHNINYTGNQWASGVDFIHRFPTSTTQYSITANASQRLSINDIDGMDQPLANYELQENIVSVNHSLSFIAFGNKPMSVNHVFSYQKYQYQEEVFAEPIQQLDTSMFRNYLSINFTESNINKLFLKAKAGIAIADRVVPIASIHTSVDLGKGLEWQTNAGNDIITIDPLILNRNPNLAIINQYSVNSSLQFQKKNHQLSGGLFYQYFNRVPYDQSDSRLSYFDDYQLIASSTSLSSGAKSSIYGLQSQWTATWKNKTFLLLGGSAYQLQVIDPENQNRNSSFNYNYTVGSTLTHTFWENFTIGLSYHWHPGAIDKYRPDPEEIRISDFHRMDARIIYKFGKKDRLSLSLDIQNVLNKKNISSYYFDVVRNEFLPINQLGMIPILSFRADFREW